MIYENVMPYFSRFEKIDFTVSFINIKSAPFML